MAYLTSTTLRTALVDYRAELLRLSSRYPDTYKQNSLTIYNIDSVLLSLEGNIDSVAIVPVSCNMHG